jgi:hypothetical protein
VSRRARHRGEPHRPIALALAIAAAVMLGIGDAKNAEANLGARPSEADAGGKAGADGAEPAETEYRALESRLEAARRQLAVEAGGAPDLLALAALHDRAEQLLAASVVGEILPRWLGVPWREGKGSTARRPDERAAAVNCGSFVVAVLESAGFRVAHRGQLGRAPALRILEAVADDGDRGDRDGIARWRGTIPALERELVRRGPGVYLLGLARHVGFAVVDRDVVRLVHASRGAGQVVDEALATSEALLRSRGAPIFVAQLFARGDERVPRAGGASRALVRRWLAGAALGPR